jgi:hypothetical protein
MPQLKLSTVPFAIAVMVTLTALPGASSPAVAETLYPWCLQYSESSAGGATSCSFVTLAQCRATLFGMGGACYENPAYPATAPKPNQRRAHRS